MEDIGETISLIIQRRDFDYLDNILGEYSAELPNYVNSIFLALVSIGNSQMMRRILNMYSLKPETIVSLTDGGDYSCHVNNVSKLERVFIRRIILTDERFSINHSLLPERVTEMETMLFGFKELEISGYDTAEALVAIIASRRARIIVANLGSRADFLKLYDSSKEDLLELLKEHQAICPPVAITRLQSILWIAYALGIPFSERACGEYIPRHIMDVLCEKMDTRIKDSTEDEWLRQT